MMSQYPTISSSEQRSDLTGIWKELVRTSTATLNQQCPSCMRMMFRVESIKKAILDALGMSEPPKINISLKSLPIPIRNGDILRQKIYEDEERQEIPSANPSKVMVVSSEISSKRTENVFEITFKIEIPWNVLSAEMREATLWFYSKKESYLNRCKFYSKPCGSSNDDFTFISTGPSDFNGEWNLFDITSTLMNWLEYEELCQEIKLNCCDHLNEIYNAASTNQSANKPFISVNLSPLSSLNRNRNKRNVNCMASSTECCRERLLVSFTQINWDNWIIQPPSFEAYYCKGKCEDIATLSLGNTPYYSVLQNLRMNPQLKDKLPVRSCCAPRYLSSLQILYVNQNGTYMEAIIPNMSVISCGCS